MNVFQREAIDRVGERYRRHSKDARAARALRAVHAHAQHSGDAITLADLERIMAAFNATRELRHP